MRTHVAALALTALLARPAAAGEPPACTADGVLLLDGLGAPDDDLARVAELAGAGPSSSQLIRRAGFRVQPACAEAKAIGWLGRLVEPAPSERGWLVLPAHLEMVWNSQYPSGGNDGLLWAGRGFSTQARVGVAGRWGVISGALAPEVAWQQNDWFETVPTGQGGNLAFQSPWYGDGLDVPQRFGAGPFATAALGRATCAWMPGAWRRRLDREPLARPRPAPGHRAQRPTPRGSPTCSWAPRGRRTSTSARSRCWRSGGSSSGHATSRPPATPGSRRWR